MFWYGLLWFGTVWFGIVLFGKRGGVCVECSRMFWKTPKSFMVGGGGSIFAITESTQVQTC